MHDSDDPTAPGGEIAREPHDRELVPDVQARDRLVEEKPVGMAVPDGFRNLAEHAGHVHARLLAARQAGGDAVFEPPEIDRVQRPGHDPRRFVGIVDIARHDAHFEHFAHEEREAETDRLGKHAARQRKPLRGDRTQVEAVEADAAVEFALAGHRLHRRRLARSVGADNRRQLAGQCPEAQVPHHGAPGKDDRDPVELDHPPILAERSLSRIQRKKGAPINAVRIPIGSSAGATTTRAIMSATSSRLPPSRADAGSRNR